MATPLAFQEFAQIAVQARKDGVLGVVVIGVDLNDETFLLFESTFQFLYSNHIAVTMSAGRLHPNSVNLAIVRGFARRIEGGVILAHDSSHLNQLTFADIPVLVTEEDGANARLLFDSGVKIVFQWISNSRSRIEQLTTFAESGRFTSDEITAILGNGFSSILAGRFVSKSFFQELPQSYAGNSIQHLLDFSERPNRAASGCPVYPGLILGQFIIGPPLSPIASTTWGFFFSAQGIDRPGKFAFKWIKPIKGRNNKNEPNELRQILRFRDVPFVLEPLGAHYYGGSWGYFMRNCTEGDLHQYCFKHKQPSVDEIALMSKRIVTALQEIHARGGAHLDVKLDNIFLTEGKLPLTWLADFGLALHEKKPWSHVAVTIDYRAPELLLEPKSYDEKVDMWAFGVVLYGMMNRKLPFGDTRGSQFTRHVLDGSYEIQSDGTQKSDELVDLIARLLEVDPRIRFSAAQALSHPFYANVPTMTEERITIETKQVMTTIDQFQAEAEAETVVSFSGV